MDVKMIVIIILVFAIFFLSIQLSEDQRELAKEELNWVNSVVYLAGFTYDSKQGIYTTRLDAMQRFGGFNSFYDRLSTLLFMVIDDETIYFEMDGKDYMIELWKGQYYASTGCEIGLYHSLPANNTCAGQMLWRALERRNGMCRLTDIAPLHCPP